MSTILDALRKAQEDARRKPVSGATPGGLIEDSPRPVRRWILLAVAAVVVVGFVGGLALGGKLRGFLPGGGSGEEAVAVLAGAPDAATEPRNRVAAAAAPAPDAEPAKYTTEAGPSGAATGDTIEPSAAGPQGRVAEGPALAPVPPVENTAPAARLQAAAAARSVQTPKPDTTIPESEVEPEAEPIVLGGPGGARAPVGERVPPAYMERQVDPNGGGETVRLKPVIRPSRPAARPAADLHAALASTGAAPVPPGVGQPEAALVPRSRPVPVEAGPRDPDVSSPGSAAVRGAVEGQAPAIVAAAPAVVRRPAEPSAPRGGAMSADILATALRRSPQGLPEVTINFVQWSATPQRRFAFICVDGSATTRVREGDEIGGLTVRHIFQQAVEFANGDSSFLLRAN